MRTQHLTILVLSTLTAVACGASSETDPKSPTNTTEYCQAVDDWQEDWSVMEAMVIVEMNKRRAAGADCNTQGTFAPAGPLTASAPLQCAARNHSVDMHIRDYFAHDSPDGYSVADRADWAGYPWMAIGENLALGSPNSLSAVNGWMGSDGHCANIMHPDFTEVGIGFHKGKHPLWTAVFGDR